MNTPAAAPIPPVSLRERQARAAYEVYSNKCLVPFEDQGDQLRATVYALVDASNDCLTAPPSEAALKAGVDLQDVIWSWDRGPLNRQELSQLWEAMVRTMLEDR